ncbi:MAG TPA: hypothetical protein VEU06_12285 [Micropepsaceae bacterium]|nr:hypothetical protein [Micropepsaceae bacterium]
MRDGIVVSVAGAALVIAAVFLMPVGAAEQAQSKAKPTSAPDNWTLPRTADGQPDLQGVWDYRTITPLERPAELGTKEFFTADEAKKFESDENQRQNRDLIDPEVGGLNYPPGGVIPYNEFWYDRGDKLGSQRTSLIVDPPDGRLPPWTPEGQKFADLRAVSARDDQLGHPHANSWEDRPLQERCLVGLNAGPPMTPGAYNNNFQLVQTPGYVVILNEMVHSARIVPMDGRPHGSIRQWKGDSRGHWEGNTLVVDTTNFKRETNVAGTSANTHLVERFTRTGPDTLLYEFTVDDPVMWTRPWKAVVPTLKSEEPIYEYACHEGNYAMRSILAGARASEKAEAGKKGLK